MSSSELMLLALCEELTVSSQVIKGLLNADKTDFENCKIAFRALDKRFFVWDFETPYIGNVVSCIKGRFYFNQSNEFVTFKYHVKIKRGDYLGERRID
jgi:hypothetical protein